MKGTVKWFDEKKGYGFITPDGAEGRSDEHFVHFNDIGGSGFKTLKEGQVVTFDSEQGKKGKQAKNVRPA